MLCHRAGGSEPAMDGCGAARQRRLLVDAFNERVGVGRIEDFGLAGSCFSCNRLCYVVNRKKRQNVKRMIVK